MRQLYISRDGMELGCLTEGEAIELLRVGFLLPTDTFREEGAIGEQSLGILQVEVDKKSIASLLLEKAAAAGGAAAAQAMRLSDKIVSAAKQGGNQVSQPAIRMLDAFTPQIQKLISRQMLEASVSRVRSATRDDGLMRKVFGATYDCLPKPVCRFVSEEAFIKYCMERRQALLRTSTAESAENIDQAS